MKDKKINISTVAKVAKGLGKLKDEMVFVGGAVVSLYADIVSDEEFRETFDVDLTSIEVLNYGKYSQLLERLAMLGFYPNPDGHAICSLIYQGIDVDLMPSEDGPIGPANKWYKIGFQNLETVMAGDEEIKIFTAPCFLATKFEAFRDRGRDYRTSHDFEDIVYVLDNRTGIVEEIKVAQREIKTYLISEFKKIRKNKYFDELLSIHMNQNTLEERYPMILEKVDQIVMI